MFDIDKWQEILSTIRKNKLRTFLTGFSVAWGIFMLIILLGAGNGLQNGVLHQFRDDAVNSIWIYPGSTSKAYKGMQPGRRIQLTNEDYKSIIQTISGVEYISARFYIRGNLTISYKNEYGAFSVRAVHPDHKFLENTELVKGRFLNTVDLDKNRKVAVIGQVVKDGLFKDVEALGEYISVNGIAFKVVGVYTDSGGENEMRNIYLPLSTAQKVFNGANKVNQLMLTTDKTEEESKIMVQQISNLLAKNHKFDKEDKAAVFVRNNIENFREVQNLFLGIELFIWIIGVGTIIAGIVGVSNIMMIVVKERTKEIGIRKAIGASPFSIVGLIIMESVVITGFAGYFGLVSGVALLEFLAANVPASDFFRNPTVDFRIAMSATILLVVSGALAGLVPAQKAARIRPIEALRDE